MMIKFNSDGRLLTESSSDRNDAIENERDKLLIQPIVRKIYIVFFKKKNKLINLDSWC